MADNPLASRYTSSLDLSQGDLATLNSILNQAAGNLPAGYTVKAISGFRPGATIAGTAKPSLHASGEALDVQIYDPQGNPVKNVGRGPGTPEYNLYQQYAIAAYNVGQQIAPDFPLGWGGNFRSGVPLDLMHFQRGDEGAGGTLAVEAGGSPIQYTNAPTGYGSGLKNIGTATFPVAPPMNFGPMMTPLQTDSGLVATPPVLPSDSLPQGYGAGNMLSILAALGAFGSPATHKFQPIDYDPWAVQHGYSTSIGSQG